MGTTSHSYMIRQNKFVDRQMFVDLLRRLIPAKDARKYFYVGMGGATLEDHRLLNRELGMEKLISFDRDLVTVRRQSFNRPTESTHLLHMSAKECIDSFWDTMREFQFGHDNAVVAWLDYTSVKEIYSQLQEVQALVSLLGSGDVLRVTMNAHAPSYVRSPDYPPGVRRLTRDEVRKLRLARVAELLGDAMPSDAQEAEMDEDSLPVVLARAVRLAIQRGLEGSPRLEWIPLCLARYADGQQMLSITGVLTDRMSREVLLRQAGLEEWEFYSRDWEDIHKFAVAELTVRERLFIDQLDMDAFDPKTTELAIAEGEEELLEMVRSYRKMRRYYPQYTHVSL